MFVRVVNNEYVKMWSLDKVKFSPHDTMSVLWQFYIETHFKTKY